jgi:hypothetical protein
MVWLYLQFLFKVNILPRTGTIPLEWNLAYRTPYESNLYSVTRKLADNSQGHFQYLEALEDSDIESLETQGMQLQLSGNYLASDWVLQFLQVWGDDLDIMGEFLARFEEDDGQD